MRNLQTLTQARSPDFCSPAAGSAMTARTAPSTSCFWFGCNRLMSFRKLGVWTTRTGLAELVVSQLAVVGFLL